MSLIDYNLFGKIDKVQNAIDRLRQVNHFRNRESVYHASLEEEAQIRDIYERKYGRREK